MTALRRIGGASVGWLLPVALIMLWEALGRTVSVDVRSRQTCRPD